MSVLSSNVVAGLPALIGVVLGLRLYADGFNFFIYVAGLFAVALLCRNVGSNLMGRFPNLAGLLIEVWIISAIAVTACGTAVVTAISFSGLLDFVVGPKHLAAEQAKTMSTALIGAVTTYVALAWTKDIGDAKGYFWPTKHFIEAMQLAYNDMSAKPTVNTRANQAIFENVIDGEGAIGWDFSARRIRTRVLADYLRSLPWPPV